MLLHLTIASLFQRVSSIVSISSLYLFFLRKISLTNALKNNRQSPFLEPFSYNVRAVLVAILFNIDLYFYCVGLWFSREGLLPQRYFSSS